MIKHCIICGTALNNNNKTREHIFLSSMGDKLISRNIICKKCNSKLGSTVDKYLAKDLSPLTKMDRIYGTNHGNKPSTVDISARDQHNELYLFNTRTGNSRLKHQIIQKTRDPNNHKIIINASFPGNNIAKARKQFKHLINKQVKRYYKKYGVKPKIIGKPDMTYKSYKGKLHISMNWNFKNYVFEIIKMGTEFATICGININKLWLERTLLLEIIQSPNINNSFFPLTKFQNMLFYSKTNLFRPTTFKPKGITINHKKMQAKLWTDNNKTLWFWVSILGILKYKIPLCSNLNKKININYNGNVPKFLKKYKDKLVRI